MTGERTLRRLAASVVFGIALAVTAHAQSVDEAAALDAEVVILSEARKHGEATKIARRSLAIREKALGPDHPDVGISLDSLATLYQDQGRYAEAEPLFKRGLAIAESARGPNHPDVGISLGNLASLYQDQGRSPKPSRSISAASPSE